MSTKKTTNKHWFTEHLEKQDTKHIKVTPEIKRAWKILGHELPEQKKAVKKKSRYNFVKTIPRKLKNNQYSFIDRDSLMLHLMFEMLCQWIEGEMQLKVEYDKNGKVVKADCLFNQDAVNAYIKSDLNADMSFQDNESCGFCDKVFEAYELYKWWTIDLPAHENEKWYNNYIDNELFFEERDKEFYQWLTWKDLEEIEMSQRLLDIRTFLWS